MKRMTNFWRNYLRFRAIFISEGPSGDRKRGRLYEPYLKKVGLNFKVASQATIYNPMGLEVGDNVYIGFNSYLGQGEIQLDHEVLIGNFVSITASNHLRKENSYRFGGHKSSKIRVGRGTWLGANSCILAGVEIGSGCLIAAGSVVTKNFTNNLVVAGVPAKVIRDLNYEK